MKLPAALVALLLLAGCGSVHATTEAVTTPTIAPDLAGHEDDTPDAEHVLVAGDSIDLTLPTGRLRITVNGPVLAPIPTLVPTKPGALHHYLATFTVTATALTGSLPLSPTAFRLLAIADQVDGGARVTTTSTATTLLTRVLSKTVVGTWTAPFVEGHGELLFTPVGALRPAALWDFRAES